MRSRIGKGLGQNIDNIHTYLVIPEANLMSQLQYSAKPPQSINWKPHQDLGPIHSLETYRKNPSEASQMSL